MVRKRRLFRSFGPPLILMAVLPLVITGMVVSKSFESHLDLATKNNLEAKARLVEGSVRGMIRGGQGDIGDYLKRQGSLGAVSFSLFPVSSKNTKNQPADVQTAFSGIVGHVSKITVTGERWDYLSVPIYDNREIIGVLQASQSRSDTERVLSGVWGQVTMIAVLSLLVGLLLAYLVVRGVGMSLRALRQQMRASTGKIRENTLPSMTVSDLSDLASTIHEVTSELGDQQREALRKQKEQDAILSSMREMLIAVDTDMRILNLNPAAGRFFGVNPEESRQRRVQSLIRNPVLHDFLLGVLNKGAPVEADLIFYTPNECYVKATGTVLRDDQGIRFGAAAVLGDMTQIKRLEAIRREFVANVSHELKTPITSISGCVETLLDGAMEDPNDARRFLEIVDRQSKRLNHIIDDLLILSKVDPIDDNVAIKLEETELAIVVEGAIQNLKPADKNVQMVPLCDKGLKAFVNASLMEQALVNLINNAVTFSPENGKVEVRVQVENEMVHFSVRDWGTGIAHEHLPRLFERFYRVDKARSRKHGGTGLGLSIVKHIAQAHGGCVKVTSELGVGSTFTISAPRGSAGAA